MTSKPIRHRLTLLLIALLLLINLIPLSGCRSPSETTGTGTTSHPTTTAGTTTTTATPESTEPTEPTPVPSTTQPDPVWINPLTGLALARQEAVDQRPIALMINNHRKAVPQIGIGRADLLFEMLVEGGITRQMAVFADVMAIPEIGSIRSARHDYIELAAGLDAILVHVGGSKLASEQFRKQKIEHIDLHVFEKAYWRDPDWKSNRGYEHSVKTTGERLADALTPGRFRTELRDDQGTAFQFRPTDAFQPAGTTPATAVRVPYSDHTVATFTYDPVDQVYSKGQFGRDQIDLASDRPLRFTNIFLVVTRVVVLPGSVLKDAALESGKGYYISGGGCQAIRGAQTDKLIFMMSTATNLWSIRQKLYRHRTNLRKNNL